MKGNKKFNKEQIRAIKYTDGPLLIIAGAGTGKTTVITEKIAHLIKSGKARPEEILALTFTDKAASEMQDRVDELLDIGYVDLHISTFHTFCQRMLEEYGLDIGISNKFKQLDETNTWLLVRKHLLEFNLDYYRPLGNPSRHIHALLNHFSKCKDELISSKKYLEYSQNFILDNDEIYNEEKNRLTEIANSYHKYNQLLLDNNYLDFGDLIFYTVKLLKTRKKIKETLQNRFKYILIDEFQDVNWAQYVLIKQLSEKSNLTVVGDDDQSIYAFRGSNVSVILRFKDDFKGCVEVVLKDNYRSLQSVLDVAYMSIQKNNPDRLEVKLNIDKKLVSRISKSDKNSGVSHIHFLTIEDEAIGVVKEIMKIMKKDKKATLDDFAILARANNHVQPFIEELEKNSIPYEYISSSGLYRQKIVIDCFSFLKVIDDKVDSTAIYRLLHIPTFNLTEYDLQTFIRICKKKSISYYAGLKRVAEFGISTEGVEIFHKLLSLIDSGSLMARHDRPHLVLYTFLEGSGYLRYLTHKEETGSGEALRTIRHLQQFFEFIAKYEATNPGSKTIEFVEYYKMILESGDAGRLKQESETQDSINILTIHGSKGLEFKYVFLVNLVEDRFPSRRRSSGIEIPKELSTELGVIEDIHLQEERRLFYVALTRAKNKMYFTSAQNYGGIRDKKISRFLDEIGFNINEKKKETIKKIISLPSNNNQNISKALYDIPKTFSFSQIKTYQLCPYKYKLSHIFKIPMKGNAHFSFGNTIHNTLEIFYRRIIKLNSLKQDALFGVPIDNSRISNIKVPTEQELLDIYKENWQDDWFESTWQRETYFKKGKDLLKIFYNVQEGAWSIPVSLEGFFKIKVGEHTINGRIDRVDKMENGSLEIIDYKTGAGKEKLTAEDKEQLLIYQIAAETLPEYKNIGMPGKLTFYYLEKNIRTSFIGKNEELEKLQTKLASTIDSICAENFKAKPNKAICDICDFREICEFREG